MINDRDANTLVTALASMTAQRDRAEERAELAERELGPKTRWLFDETARADRYQKLANERIEKLAAAQLEIVELRRVLSVVRTDLRQHELGGNSVWPSSSVILVTDTLTHSTVSAPLLAALKLAFDALHDGDNADRKKAIAALEPYCKEVAK